MNKPPKVDFCDQNSTDTYFEQKNHPLESSL